MAGHTSSGAEDQRSVIPRETTRSDEPPKDYRHSNGGVLSALAHPPASARGHPLSHRGGWP